MQAKRIPIGKPAAAPSISLGGVGSGGGIGGGGIGGGEQKKP